MMAPNDETMVRSLTAAENIKFEVLAHGIAIDESAMAFIDERNQGRALTPADYASTSGVILRLEGDVWVNAPISRYNPNFVDAPTLVLGCDEHGLLLQGMGASVRAEFWLPPAYHDELNSAGAPHVIYAFTHGDRVRISPITGCSYTCKFCNLPYEFRYRRKDLEGLVEAVAAAREDPIQPAHHVLISGGTPRPEDFDFLPAVYESIITTFPDMPVDIMMVPAPEVVDVRRLADVGVNELSINLEIFNTEIARHLMPRKFRTGLDHHLAFIADAVNVLGAGRVRSMLMVGLEPLEDTMAGVRALLDVGCVPVLSPFRPDPLTPLRDTKPPSAELMREAYVRARTASHAAGLPLGPVCRPCSHNTLSLADSSSNGDATYQFGTPRMV